MIQGFFASSEVQKEKPDVGLVPKCGSCGLYRRCKSPKMEPYGKGRAGVLIVGEAPGEEDDKEGRPFAGKVGSYLRDTLEAIGINLDQDCLSTNALICRLSTKLDPKQIGYCRPNLLNTLREFEPKVVITLGGTALRSVIREFWKGDIGEVEKWVGWKIPLRKFWVCPTYHPFHIFRAKPSEQRILETEFARQLRAAFDLEDSPPPLPNYREQVEIILEEDRIVKAIDEMEREGGWAGVDYETNCLKPEYPAAEIVSFAISNARRTISYPWWGKAVEATSRFLRSPRVRKVCSNMKMEQRWTRKFLKHRIVNLDWDTMLAAHCLDNRPGICSLKFQSFVRLGIESYNENIEPYLEGRKGSHYNRIHEIKLETLLLYGGFDALYERLLGMTQRKDFGFED